MNDYWKALNMKIADKINLFKKELEEKKNLGKFNVWAFIFSSFYFFYVGMSGYFLGFAFIPAIICLHIPKWWILRDLLGI